MANLKSIAQLLCVLLVVILTQALATAQTDPSFRISKIVPYDKAVPGQILELQVEGLGGAPPVTMLPPEDFQVEVTQDGVKQLAHVRIVLPTMSREQNSGGTMGEMKPFQNVSFVVPHGLHSGEANIVLVYKSKESNLMTLTIVDRPLRPVIAGPAVMTMAPSSLPAPLPGTRVSDMGWRFERDSKAQLFLKPLTDPDDPGAAILIRFKQGGAYYDAVARVMHQSQTVEHRGRGVTFLPAREFLEVEIPAALTLGPADMDIRVRANGAESDPFTIKVQIADSTRSAEAPAVNAPRLLAVTPRKVGAGQALMLSVDYLRTLAPDPSQTLVSIEQDTARYIAKPEGNSALRMPNKSPDAPVMLMAYGYAQGLAGNVGEARAALQKLQQLAGTRFVPNLYPAAIHVGLGEADEAFHLLDLAYQERIDRLVYLNVDPMADPIRSDPRFAQLMAKIRSH